MRVLFGSSKHQKLFSSEKELTRAFGLEQARVIMRRLSQLEAADNLAVMGCLPPARCHELTGARAGQFAVSLREPYRLVFVPALSPVPLMGDGGIDRSKVTEIRIIEVVDYHG